MGNTEKNVDSKTELTVQRLIRGYELWEDREGAERTWESHPATMQPDPWVKEKLEGWEGERAAQGRRGGEATGSPWARASLRAERRLLVTAGSSPGVMWPPYGHSTEVQSEATGWEASPVVAGAWSVFPGLQLCTGAGWGFTRWHWCLTLTLYWNVAVGENSAPGKMSSNAEAGKYGLACGKHHFIYGWNVRYGTAVKSYWCEFWSQAAWLESYLFPYVGWGPSHLFLPLSSSLLWE